MQILALFLYSTATFYDRIDHNLFLGTILGESDDTSCDPEAVEDFSVYHMGSIILPRPTSTTSTVLLRKPTFHHNRTHQAQRIAPGVKSLRVIAGNMRVLFGAFINSSPSPSFSFQLP
jgi:hypothetical protein